MKHGIVRLFFNKELLTSLFIDCAATAFIVKDATTIGATDRRTQLAEDNRTGASSLF